MHARVLVPRVLVVDATPRRPDRDRIVARAVPSLVCLDRDGVINVDVGPPGVTDVEQFALIPGAARAVGALNDAGATVCVVTNQTAVGKGFMEERYLTDVVHEEMRRALTRVDARRRSRDDFRRDLLRVQGEERAVRTEETGAGDDFRGVRGERGGRVVVRVRGGHCD